MILDAETASFIEVAKKEAPFALLKQTGLATVGDDVPLRPEVEQWIRGRIEMVQAGVERCPPWFAKTLKRFDPDLRLRWDFYQDYWVIERFDKHANLFRRCGTWSKELGHNLIEELRKSDMWRTTTDEKIAQAEEQAGKVKQANEQKTRDGYMEKIDNMSHRQLEDFVEVSRALEHGETLSFAGKDADMMNKIWEEKKHRPDTPDTALNPGVKPGKYRRPKE